MLKRTVPIDAIVSIAENKSISIIGIDGLGGAGKSTISEMVCSELRRNGIHTILLHIDDFIHTRQIRYNSEYLEWRCYYDLQWRYDYFLQIVKRLKAAYDNSVEVERYDKDNDNYYTETYTITGKTTVVVEGIFLQRKELQGIFDYMVYIDVPEDVRLSRVLQRDTYIGNERQIIDKYKTRYFPAERHYFSIYQPDQSADCVIGE
ncbi:MAG: uridine kinase [Oscillospiraceae bacterium]|nr:uridine kinase [Oscillospiraceae bacterium]